jgi:ABC-2 type transport system ATP-binding protein
LDVVERLCDRVIILHRGQIVADAATRELLDRTERSLEDVFQSLTITPEEQQLANELIASMRPVRAAAFTEASAGPASDEVRGGGA